MLDVQFSFTTVSAGWLAWLSMGSLLTRPHEDVPASEGQVFPWIALSGALLMRVLVMSGQGIVPLLILLAACLVVGRVWTVITWRQMVVIAGWWLVGWASARVREPTWVGVMDIAMVLVAVGWLWLLSPPLNPLPATQGGDLNLLHDVVLPPLQSLERGTGDEDLTGNRNSLNFRLLLWAIVVLIVVVLAIRNDTAMVYIRQAYTSGFALPVVADLDAAAKLRPWDDRVAYMTASAKYQAAFNQPEGVDRVLLDEAWADARRAAELDPYDGNYAFMLALIEAQQPQPQVSQIDGYYRAAARLNPTEAVIWSNWSGFALHYGGDALAAYWYAGAALRLTPDDRYAQMIRQQAQQALIASYR
jgi:hypothetical protein